ncbi:hypothetical protein T440DRAFT_44355 [Plenodomus tracheiphilus IPT5]|uniref:Uncharacterized protein n=1 Tax=Plenodomus tracheiphilus IPT5 TaxID=1408161 RepID=A0A6A7APZ8_9PLEO|nr:hypothetical protein T440DRAFT_44355 [Plenodomus tracheiphilus IPT5]
MLVRATFACSSLIASIFTTFPTLRLLNRPGPSKWRFTLEHTMLPNNVKINWVAGNRLQSTDSNARSDAPGWVQLHTFYRMLRFVLCASALRYL